MNYADYDYIVRLCYTFATLVLYLLLFSIMSITGASEQYQTAFYKIFKTTIVINVMSQISWMICPKLLNPTFTFGLLSLLPERGFIITLVPFLQYYSYYSMVLLELLISFNRFSAVLLRAAYSAFWRRYLRYFISTCLILPLCLTWHFWITDCMLVKKASTNMTSFHWDQYNKTLVPYLHVQLVSITLLTSTGILSFVFNLYTGLYLVCRSTKKQTNIERKLFVYSIAMFLSICINNFKNIAIYTYPRILSFVFIYLDYGPDFSFLIPPWFMILINTEIKRSVLSFLTGQTGNPHVFTVSRQHTSKVSSTIASASIISPTHTSKARRI